MAIRIRPAATGVGAQVTGFDPERCAPDEASALYDFFISTRCSSKRR